MKAALPFFAAWLGVALALTAAEPKPPSAARSVHLFYPAPPGTIFYNELTVQESQRGTYFMSCGFSQGYFGIQQIGAETNKVVIFSVWDPGDQNDPKSVATDQRVEVLHEGEGVNVSRFGGEGTGGKSMFPYQWKNGETYRFAVHAVTNENKTAYAAYFFLNDKKEWKHLATFRTRSNGKPLSGYYSFIEDFRRDGKSPHERRRAQFGNGWIKTVTGDWLELTKATFTADGTPLDNIDAAVRDKRFQLATGGDTIKTTPLPATITRAATGPKPVDLEKVIGLLPAVKP